MGKVLPVFKVLSMIHPKISILMSLTQQNSAFSDYFPKEEQVITDLTAACAVLSTD